MEHNTNSYMELRAVELEAHKLRAEAARDIIVMIGNWFRRRPATAQSAKMA